MGKSTVRGSRIGKGESAGERGGIGAKVFGSACLAVKVGTTHIRAVAGVSQAKKPEWRSHREGRHRDRLGGGRVWWPVGQGDAFPTKPSSRRMRLKTANGGDMTHCGQKDILFQSGGRGGDPLGLTFQVTDVRNPLLSVRRLVEKGNTVLFAGDDQESHMYNMDHGEQSEDSGR